MEQPCILVVGNPSEGYRYLGPFADFDAAAQFSESVDSDTWVATLEIPEGAALLAAAPDLLAACKAALAYFDTTDHGNCWRDAGGEEPDLLLAAIRKAEGRDK